VRQAWAGMNFEEIRSSLLLFFFWNKRSSLLLCEGPKEMLRYILHLQQSKTIRTVDLLWNSWIHTNKINAGDRN
jgi:hypothetical protein